MNILTLLLLACQDITLNQIKEPNIIVAPATLDFGHLISGEETLTKQITITNGGTDEEVIKQITIDGQNFEGYFAEAAIEPNGWLQFDITYSPKTFEHNEGLVEVYLEGDNSPIGSVSLVGNGDAPLIEISPPETDFGTPTIGCESSKEISIENKGNLDLTVEEIYKTTSVPQEIFTNYGTLPDFPWTIPANSRLVFYLEYKPEDSLRDEANLTVVSNDPLNEEVLSKAFGEALEDNNRVQSWIQRSVSLVDIIWVIDNSGSMQVHQSNLIQNMSLFMNMFLSFSPDYQMVFITTDNPSFVGGLSIDQTNTSPTSDASYIVSTIGVGGHSQEQGLEMLRICLDIGDCRDWIREGAMLVPIFLSDEADHSPISIRAYQNYFDNIRPNAFLPFGIIGDVPGGCNFSTLGATAGFGYADVIDYYNSQWWSICGQDWGLQMEEVAVSVALDSSFVLDEEGVIVDSIQVYVNGQLREEGWEWNENLNSIVFDFESIPLANDLIEVSYSFWDCD